MKNRLCYHIELGGIGIIQGSMKGNKEFSDQYGIFWLLNANCLNYPNHPYWNDISKIKIFKHGDLLQK